jgi:hypothetical protein
MRKQNVPHLRTRNMEAAKLAACIDDAVQSSTVFKGQSGPTISISVALALRTLSMRYGDVRHVTTEG